MIEQINLAGAQKKNLLWNRLYLDCAFNSVIEKLPDICHSPGSIYKTTYTYNTHTRRLINTKIDDDR